MRLVTSGDEFLPQTEAMLSTLNNCFKDCSFIQTASTGYQLWIGISAEGATDGLFRVSSSTSGGVRYLNFQATTNVLGVPVFNNNDLTEAGSKLFKVLDYIVENNEYKYKLGTYISGDGNNALSIHARGNSGLFFINLPGTAAHRIVSSLHAGTNEAAGNTAFLNSASDGPDYYSELLNSAGSNLHFSPILLPSTNTVSAVDTNGYCIMPLVFSYGIDKIDGSYIAYGNPAGPTSSGYVTMDGHGFSVHLSPWGDSYNMIFIGDPDKV